MGLVFLNKSKKSTSPPSGPTDPQALPSSRSPSRASPTTPRSWAVAASGSPISPPKLVLPESTRYESLKYDRESKSGTEAKDRTDMQWPSISIPRIVLVNPNGVARAIDTVKPHYLKWREVRFAPGRYNDLYRVDPKLDSHYLCAYAAIEPDHPFLQSSIPAPTPIPASVLVDIIHEDIPYCLITKRLEVLGRSHTWKMLVADCPETVEPSQGLGCCNLTNPE